MGFFETFQDAAQNAVARYGRGPFLIRQIGAPPSAMPTSVLYQSAISLTA